MTEREQLKGDLIAREIASLYALFTAKELEALEHIVSLTIGPPADCAAKYAAADMLKPFIRQIREHVTMLHRIDKEFKP